MRGAYLAPGFIDLHVWGAPQTLAQASVRGGATAFLSAVGPAPVERMLAEVEARANAATAVGATCLGLHLEGPFLNPARGGALPKRWMRRPTARELARLVHAGRGRIKLITLAPELPGALQAIRWCRAHGVVASLGHSDATATQARSAVRVGARAVTHMFNGMAPFHQRHSSLVDAALLEDRLTAMIIMDDVHVSADAFRLLVRAKGIERVALVTDSITHQGWDVVERHGAYYLRSETLAGSSLTMMRAVRNAVVLGGVSVTEAVRMASENPARLLGDRSRGRLSIGARADLVAFDKRFRISMTMVGGHVVYQRKRS